MENKINIAELLKDCPRGMELDCTTWENVTFEKVRDDNIFIRRNNKQPQHDSIVVLNEYGCVTNHEDEKCRIFPKGKTTWKGFQRPFKDGDIVATINGEWIGITTGGEKGKCIPTYCVIKDNNAFEAYLDVKRTWWFNRLATEEEKQKLFQAIKDNDYKWNADTKTLEKLVEPYFKVGDRIRRKKNTTITKTIGRIYSDSYALYDGHLLYFKEQDEWELVPNKFDVNTLKPFESKVLVRHNKTSIWMPAIFGGYMDKLNHSYYAVGGTWWEYCIPYEGNEHLRGTTNDCRNHYKTWE